MFSKKTAEQSLENAKVSLTLEVGQMKEAQEQSLNIFRKTVNDLSDQNEQLQAKRSMAINMAQDMNNLADSAENQMAENTKVIDKITEFLD